MYHAERSLNVAILRPEEELHTTARLLDSELLWVCRISVDVGAVMSCSSGGATESARNRVDNHRGRHRGVVACAKGRLEVLIRWDAQAFHDLSRAVRVQIIGGHRCESLLGQ